MVRSTVLLFVFVASLLLTPASSAQEVQRLDPNGTRLFLSPTARTMPQGQGRFSDYFIFFPSVAYGFTDWFDASLGVSILPGSSTQILTLNAKAQAYDGEAVDVAVGNLFLAPIGEGTGEGFGGTAYGLVTFGSTRSAVTIGTYVAYAGVDASRTECNGDVCTTEDNFDVEVADGTVLVLGGEVQVSNSVKFISENYLGFGGGETGGLISGGVRFFGDNLAVDFAFFRPVSNDDDWAGFPFVPYVGFAYNFGR